ncbi:hypothetical protein J3R83DRAFT_10543 [Lanmaoa asiatica]|nr:hypothetical protein J3R83DRAFT_10543 [Lanmaoa asiatica]
MQNQTFLSPRSPRRTSVQGSWSRCTHFPGAPTIWVDQLERSRGESYHRADIYMHSASEPFLNSPFTQDDEEEPLSKGGIDGLPHSDVLFSIIEEVGSSPGPFSDSPETGIDEPLRPKVFPKHSKRSHQQTRYPSAASFTLLLTDVLPLTSSFANQRRNSSLQSNPNPTSLSQMPTTRRSNGLPSRGRSSSRCLSPRWTRSGFSVCHRTSISLTEGGDQASAGVFGMNPSTAIKVVGQGAD